MIPDNTRNLLVRRNDSAQSIVRLFLCYNEAESYEKFKLEVWSRFANIFHRHSFSLVLVCV
jgi:hypothetical protein